MEQSHDLVQPFCFGDLHEESFLMNLKRVLRVSCILFGFLMASAFQEESAIAEDSSTYLHSETVVASDNVEDELDVYCINLGVGCK